VVTAEPEQPEVQAQAVQTAETLPETQEAAQPTTKLESHTEAPQAQPEQTEVEAPEAQLIQDVPKAGQAEETTVQEDTFSAVDAQSQTDADAGAVLDDDADENDSTVTVSDGGAVAQPIFRQVESDMVKVGEPEPTEESQQAADVNQQIADQLTSSLENGETKVEIKLSPSSLGNVTVEVTAQENGALHIALSAENSHTKALLEQHVAGLQDLVSSQSQRSVQVEVAQRQENHQGGLQSDDQSGRGGYQQQQHRQQSHDDESFLQKLRLGLLPLSVDAVES
jgi:flagellar hook-length control protein FliK